VISRITGAGLGIGLDVELVEGGEAGADEHQQAQHDDRPARQPEGEQAFSTGQLSPPLTMLSRMIAPLTTTRSPRTHAVDNLVVAAVLQAELTVRCVK
jgi:hypothetical protein